MIKFKKGEFLTVPNRQEVLKLRGAQLNVYLAICGYADNNGQCFPSYKSISEATGYSKRAAMDAVEQLKEAGFFAVRTQRRPNESFTSNLYQLILIDEEILNFNSADLVNHSSLPSEPQFTSITKTINKEEDKSSSHVDLLTILNEKTGRSFRVLPRGSTKLLQVFSLGEIEKALAVLATDPWHEQRLGELSSDYLLRSTTIDKFLTGTPARTKGIKRF